MSDVNEAVERLVGWTDRLERGVEIARRNPDREGKTQRVSDNAALAADLRALLADHARLREAEQRVFMTGYEIWVDGFRAAIGREPWDDAEDYAAVRGQAYVRLWLALASRPEGGE